MKRLIYLFLLLSVCPGRAQILKNSLVSTARQFLATLDTVQLHKANYAFEDDERFNWYFVPHSRNGLPIKEMNDNQKDAALALLKATLSEQGYQKAYAITQLEIILKALEKRGETDDYRDPTKYYFTIFGKPDDKKPWCWRIEGHHLSLHFSAVEGRIVSATPSFWGSNPAIVPEGKKKDYRILKQEPDLAFQLLNSFSETQLKKAVFSDKALPEIVTFNNRKAILQTPEGISYTELNKAQQQIFLKLVKEYVKNYPLDFAADFMRKIESAGLDKLHFAWAGSLKWGSGHYYRIQNPVLLIEYDNTQTNANHIHTVIRDLTNDFGENILRNHYEKEHK
jgi:hypothetical protein